MSAGAPRRRRPGRWIALALLGVVAGWAIVEMVWHLTGEPAALVDYGAELERLAADRQPAGPDGWAHFARAGSIYADVADEIGKIELPAPDARRGERPPPLDFRAALAGPLELDLIAPERRALELLVERGAFDALAEGAACPRAVRPMPRIAGPLVGMLLPDLAILRELTAALDLRMRLAAAAGDGAVRASAFEQSLATARACASQPTLIEGLVGAAVARRTALQARRDLDDHGIDETTGRAMLAAMDRQPLPSLSVSIEGERLGLRDIIQWTSSDDGHGDGWIDTDRLDGIAAARPPNGLPAAPRHGGLLIGRVRTLAIAGRAELTALADEYFKGLAKNAELKPATRRKRGFDASTWFDGRLTYRHLLLNLMLPAIARAIENNDATRLDLEATRAALAIETFRARHGRLPASLDDLVPDILPALPCDPTHGGPFLYEGPEAGSGRSGYTLASVPLKADGTLNRSTVGTALRVDLILPPPDRGTR